MPKVSSPIRETLLSAFSRSPDLPHPHSFLSQTQNHARQCFKCFDGTPTLQCIKGPSRRFPGLSGSAYNRLYYTDPPDWYAFFCYVCFSLVLKRLFALSPLDAPRHTWQARFVAISGVTILLCSWASEE